MSGPRLVVKIQKSRLWYMLLAGACFAALALSYVSGRYFAIETLEQSQQQVETLRQQLTQTELSLDELSAKLVMQEQFSQVDDQSREQLLQTVKQLQVEQARLQEELDFYHRIMAPEKKSAGLTIADFAVLSAEGADQYEFKLALTQTGKQDQFLKGDITINIKGQLKGNEKQFEIRELGTFDAKQFEFQFRYFQNIEGRFSLPGDFVPSEIEILAKTKGLRKNQSVSASFPRALQE